MQQKLYTEEQVRNAFIDGMKFIAVHPLKYEQDANEYMDSLTPIKLPSDNKDEQFARIYAELDLTDDQFKRNLGNNTKNK
jgi:hypothetical protein